MAAGLLSKCFTVKCFNKKCNNISLSILIVFCALAGLSGTAFSQPRQAATELIDSLRRLEELNPHLICYLPGANFQSHGDTNLFTRIYCLRMKEIMESQFVPLNCAAKHLAVRNVFWALWHAQYPIRNPEHESRIRSAVKLLSADSLTRKSGITMVSSSYATVVAAQLAVYTVNNRQRFGLGPEPLNLVFGASMLSKKSRLYQELEHLKSENQIGSIIYDELQYPGDNVTGMCGDTRRYALAEVCRIAFPIFGPYKSQPSILNRNPVTGHIHRKREILADNVNDYISTPLVNYELAGPWFKIRALESLSRHPN